MGTDRVRHKIRRDADPAALDAAVERQAFAYQAMMVHAKPYACTDLDPLGWPLRKRLFLDAFLAASCELESLLEEPEWDEENGRPSDDPTLDVSRRVSSIGFEPTFLPLWRVQAQRTLLPQQAISQARRWRGWAEEAAAGLHDDYLRELFLNHASDSLHFHSPELRRTAWLIGEEETLARDMVTLPDRVLRLPEPVVHDARIDPEDPPEVGRGVTALRTKLLLDGLAEMVAVTRSWNDEIRAKRWIVEALPDERPSTGSNAAPSGGLCSISTPDSLRKPQADAGNL